MGRIVVSEFISLDGVMEDPAAWIGQVGGEVAARLEREAAGAEALLLGRRTYAFLAARWPSREGALADRLNGMRKYVVSSTLDGADWDNTVVVRGDAVDEVETLRHDVEGDVVVYGSLELVRALMAHDLVDELRLTVYPVVLGAGRRLFGTGGDRKPLRLLGAETVSGGIAVLTYAALSVTGFVATATTEIDAPPEDVWRTITDPAAIKRFMFDTTVETDWQPGSPIVWRGEFRGKAYEDRGEVLAVEAGRLLRHTHFSSLSGRDDTPENHHTVTYTLEPSATGTVLTLTQDKNPSQEAADHAKANWELMLGQLKAVAEEGAE